MQNQTPQNSAQIKYLNNRQQEISEISMLSTSPQNPKSKAESGRMHIAFDQDLDIPDVFVCRGR
jgi:hypothetical protein